MTKGWYGDRERHALASKGVRTTFSPRIVNHNGKQYLEADGILYKPRMGFINEVNGQLRCLKAYGVEDYFLAEEGDSVYKEYEEETPKDIGFIDTLAKHQDINIERDKKIQELEEITEDKQEEAEQKMKEAKQLEEDVKLQERSEDVERKAGVKEKMKEIRDAEAEAGVGVGGAKKWLTEAGKKLWEGTKKFIDTSPSMIRPKPSTGMAGKDDIFGKVSQKRAKDTGKPTSPSAYNDVNKDMYRSIDSDSIIATVENKEKLIQFANDLEHDIDLLDVSLHKKTNEFRTEERKDIKLFSNEVRKSKSELKDEINLTKTSGANQDDIKFDINNLKVTFDYNVNKLKNALKTQKMQNRADLKYIDDLRDDLDKLHNQTDKRIKQMVASGIRR